MIKNLVQIDQVEIKTLSISISVVLNSTSTNVSRQIQKELNYYYQLEISILEDSSMILGWFFVKLTGF